MTDAARRAREHTCINARGTVDASVPPQCQACFELFKQHKDRSIPEILCEVESLRTSVAELADENSRIAADVERLEQELKAPRCADRARLLNELHTAAAESARLAAELAEANRKLDLVLWECPECSFRYDNTHSHADGSHSCPNCAEQRLAARVAEMAEALRPFAEHIRDKHGRGGGRVIWYEDFVRARAALASETKP